MVAVLTAQDVIAENDSSPLHTKDEPILPTEVSYHGQPVAWVVAEDEEIARAAAQTIDILYQPETDAILNIEQAVAHNSFHGRPRLIEQGHPQKIFKDAKHTLTGQVFVGGQDHFYLESQASWAIPDAEGNIQIYASTQHPSEVQAIVAKFLGVSRNQVVVTCLRLGGGFGGKETQATPLAAIAALAAFKTARPARVRLNRQQDMTITGKRHAFLGKYKVAFDSKGKLLALILDLYSDGGWSSDLSQPVMERAMLHSDNAYFIPNMKVQGWVCKTNKPSNTAFRGFGGPQGMVIIEDIIDSIARYLNLPVETVRGSNFYQEGQSTHYGQKLTDVRIERVWNEVKLLADFTKRKTEVINFNQQNFYYKRGIAITPVKFGIAFTHKALNQAGALLLIYTDGSIQLNHGGTEMGQGLHTKMLQVAAETLGVSIERFRVMPTSTDKVPNTSATAASSSSDLNGQAVKEACETLKTRLALVAAKALNVKPATEIIFKENWLYSFNNASNKISFNEVVTKAYEERISLSATGYYRTPNIYFDVNTGKGHPFYYFTYGAAVSEVEVDGFTGCFKLRQVDIVHDVGESLNPLVDRGQVEGGFVQGMGWLTTEELVWSDEGHLLTHAPSTYKIPTISEIPERFEVMLLKKAEQHGVIYGSKAVGEPPFMLAISVREAIRFAVAAFGEKAKQVKIASPATPEAILMAIKSVAP